MKFKQSTEREALISLTHFSENLEQLEKATPELKEILIRLVLNEKNCSGVLKT